MTKPITKKYNNKHKTRINKYNNNVKSKAIQYNNINKKTLNNKLRNIFMSGGTTTSTNNTMPTMPTMPTKSINNTMPTMPNKPTNNTNNTMPTKSINNTMPTSNTKSTNNTNRLHARKLLTINIKNINNIFSNNNTDITHIIIFYRNTNMFSSNSNTDTDTITDNEFYTIIYNNITSDKFPNLIGITIHGGNLQNLNLLKNILSIVNLQKLSINYIDNLVLNDNDDDFSNLINLDNLELIGCKSLTVMPKSVYALPNLKSINVSYSADTFQKNVISNATDTKINSNKELNIEHRFNQSNTFNINTMSNTSSNTMPTMPTRLIPTSSNTRPMPMMSNTRPIPTSSNTMPTMPTMHTMPMPMIAV